MNPRHTRAALAAAWLMAAAAFPLGAQSTQGIITGRVHDRETGEALATATVSYENLATGQAGSAPVDSSGAYTILSLSPGRYRLRAEDRDDGYQPQEFYDMDLAVAARMQLDFPLRRRSDVLERSVSNGFVVPGTDALVHFFGPDIEAGRLTALRFAAPQSETLQSTLSYVVDARQLERLPLSGRDVYTVLVALPGVTADNATARGLGISVNGQRASSSNFLLDGLENNDYLLTGPSAPLTPEAVQEYRVSLNNYSAEFGRAAGFVANAVTHSGGNALHGLGYAYLNHDALNANSFQHNAGFNTATGERGARALRRQPRRELRAGFRAGGPIRRERLFWSAAFEQFRNRSREDPAPFQAPILERFETCPQIGGDSRSLALLRRFRPSVTPVAPAAGPCEALSGRYDLGAPVSIDRSMGLARVDYESGGNRLAGRLLVSRQSQPDFVFSIYPDFTSGLEVNSTAAALVYTRLLGTSASNEIKAGWRAAGLEWARAHPEIPSLSTHFDGGELYRFGISLPGSPASFGYRNRGRYWELADTFLRSRGNHAITAGGGLLLRRTDSLLNFRETGIYFFDNLQQFGQDRPVEFQASFSRQLLPERMVQPRYDREYANRQFFAFVQDSVRIGGRLSLNAGVRYEWFGAPRSTGVQDGYLRPGEGSTIAERLEGARLTFPEGGTRSLYRVDRNNFAGRFGIAYNLSGGGRTLLRGGYGIFYDRPFDNLTENMRNNSMELVTVLPPFQYLRPIEEMGPLRGLPVAIPRLLWLDENLRTPYAQSWFAGVQQQVSENLYLEVSQTGALGRKLIASDLVNRRAAASSGNEGRLNPELRQDVLFRSNFGSSSYTALAALARYRAARGQFHVSYTWSHSIDNQSDPLQGHFDDLQFVRSGGRGNNLASLTRQFDSRADRGSSDFDQRHNLVFYSLWDLPSPAREGWLRHLLNGWQAAQIAGFRSGFPYNLIATSFLPACPGEEAPGAATLVRNRPSLLPGRQALLAAPEPVPGGVKLLDESSFCNPGSRLGNVGRNSLTGPGFWNVDLSAGKRFPLQRLGEAAALVFRADFFNALNHANLGDPEGLADLGERGTFGEALWGRRGKPPAFPSVTPLDQSPRQIQLQLKLVF
jgi:hypothetical protein